jgi:hypothetical protein
MSTALVSPPTVPSCSRAGRRHELAQIVGREILARDDDNGRLRSEAAQMSDAM